MFTLFVNDSQMRRRELEAGTQKLLDEIIGFRNYFHPRFIYYGSFR